MSDETETEPETEETEEPEPTEGQTFDASYVTRLRQEAAERRVAARTAGEESLAVAAGALEALRGRLLNLEIEAATAGVLADPTDLLTFVNAADLADDDGNPDAGKIKTAAAELASRKPHLAPRLAPTGDVDQGARAPGPEAFDLAGALRAAAG